MNNKTNNDSTEHIKDAARGAQVAVQAAKRYASQDYIGGTLLTVGNLKYIIAAIVTFIILPLLLIIMLPAVLLTSNNAVIDKDSMFSVYEEIHNKVNEYFEESFLEAYREAYERATEKAEGYRDEYEITIEIESPYENNDFIEISNIETNEIMAIHGIVSQYDKSSEYNDITVTLRNFFDLDSSDDIYDQKFLKTVRKYSQNLYVVGNPSFIDTGMRTELREVKDSEGNTVIDEETGTPKMVEVEIKTGKVKNNIIKGPYRYYENEIEKIKGIAWNSYTDNVSAGVALVKDKTRNQTDLEIENQISDMARYLQLMFAPNSESEDVNVVASRRDDIIKAFIGSDQYLEWTDKEVTSLARLPYRSNVISSGYGWRLLYGESNFHNALDFSWSGCKLADIPSVADGIVVYAFGNCLVDEDPSLGYGNLVIIYHGKKNGYDFFTLYGHCEKVYVSTGQFVSEGQTIAGIGKRGNSTGYHLHFETVIPMGSNIKAVNPAEWLLEK